MLTRKRLHQYVMTLALLGLVFGSSSCALTSQLTEDAKPQTIPERFLVGAAEFNRIANEANIWLDGVLDQAALGDVSAAKYIPIVERVSNLISEGNRIIQDGQVAFDAGNLTGILNSADAVNRALTRLQRELLAAGVGVGGTVSHQQRSDHERYACLIHVGNTMKDVSGCIAVGRKGGFLHHLPGVRSSRKAMDDLCTALGREDTHTLMVRSVGLAF